MSVKLDPCPTRTRRLRRFNAAGTAFLRSPSRSKVVERKRDSLGRRYEKKVSVDGETTFHQRCAYRNYLQIAAFDVSVDSGTEEEVLSLATTTAWDPMEPQATRPLAFSEHSGDAPATYFHTHDLTKNVCELIDSNGADVSACDYAPFGAVAISGTPTRNPFQFSSEVYDPETALVYCNYRHYNPIDGRWISRDPIGEEGGSNLYCFLSSATSVETDFIGLEPASIALAIVACIIAGLSISVHSCNDDGATKSESDKLQKAQNAADILEVAAEEDREDKILKATEKATQNIWPNPVNPAQIMHGNILPGLGKQRGK